MGKTSSKAKDRYNAKAYDELKLRVPKGQKEAIENHAKAKGESVNGLINSLLRIEMGKNEDEWKNPISNGQMTDE